MKSFLKFKPLMHLSTSTSPPFPFFHISWHSWKALWQQNEG